MSKHTKSGKCPKCAPEGNERFPNGYALFHKDYEIDEATGKGRSVWKCNNCNHTIPVRVLRTLETPLPRMQEIIDRLHEAFGGTVETKMMGRKTWITLRNEARTDTKIAYGTVAANGRFSITVLGTWTSKETVVTDWIGVRIWMADGRK